MKKYITSTPDIVGGAPVVAGTRVPIARILYLIKDGLTLEQIQEHYPHVSLETLRGVINELAQKVETKFYGQKISQA
ncbi:DUF433 domain-containing protein [Candidatus Daviesbacteria bacterium]|nr:DUF433 domain-containing protein [Candidatus Daviesbacteria bacterium]